MSASRLLAACLVASLCLGTIAFVSPQEQVSRAVVVYIGNHADDPNSAITGLILATNLQGHGGEVSLFLDREAVRLADSRQSALVLGAFNSDDLLNGLLEGGARIVLCPPGAAAAGVEAAYLKDGTQIGPASLIAELFLNSDVVVDY